MNKKFVYLTAGLFCFTILSVYTASTMNKQEQVTSNKSVETIAYEESKLEKAMFGAGCFWGVEDVFRQVDGVVDAAVGYSGGKTENPTYREVCTGNTGHAEVCQVIFDPEKISYEELLDIFWKIHDPTQLNRQGPDFGTQYRSAIYTYNDKQFAQAKKSKEQLEKSGLLDKPIATEITPADTFWRAEEYHQQYNKKNGVSCHISF